MMWGYGGFGFLWMALFWVGVVLLVTWAVRESRDREVRSETRTGNRAEEILAERYARGDIDAEEFEVRRRELMRF